MANAAVKHEVYGRGKVDADALASSDDMITFHIDTPRDTAKEISTYTVGKVALDNQGGYIPKKRQNVTRIEQYLPLVSGCVAALKRPEDDWDELYAVGCLGLVEADSRYDDKSPYPFAAFAKPSVMGKIKDSINPVRNGTMNQVQMDEDFDAIDESGGNHEDVWRAFYLALEHMTKKQAQIMKLLYIEGHSWQNAADIMGLDKSSVRDLRDRAVRHVRKKLGATGA